jgi:hypothetical protein
MWMAGVAGALALSGCADFAADAALRDAQAKCARQGMQFVPDQVQKTELVVVSSAQVSGHCEPSFAPPPPPAGG